ncbi:acid phosphatase 1-like [Iris pallida]|uniref:Acid phosphatase 1-like n=1 Tax=Iris pallida TaxID=29817 RepID=A0AAX6HWC9_IRIPA|nr:acid phosphatase 1-like [Iris pallida]
MNTIDNNLLLSLLLLFFFFSLSLSAAAAAAAAADEPSSLPRPLILELPTGPRPEEEQHQQQQFRCSSWRVAGEANNLSPWRTVPPECAGYVREYMRGKKYRADLDLVASEAAAYARSLALAGDGRDAWLFDIDETLLSNLPYYADHGFGLELFNGQEFDKWVEMAMAPAIESSLKLYEEVKGLGYKIFLLTGRGEGQRMVTTYNLNKVGIEGWEKLILRGLDDHGKPAKTYKSEKRAEIEAEGYRILGNSGDQWSDLLGFATSDRSFKLPNPMYYIP